MKFPLYLLGGVVLVGVSLSWCALPAPAQPTTTQPVRTEQPQEKVSEKAPYDAQKSAQYVAWIKQQRLALSTHLDSVIRDYPADACTTDASSCVDYLQNKLFAVPGYAPDQGVDGFAQQRQKLQELNKNEYAYLPEDKQLLVDYFDTIQAQMLWVARQPLHTHSEYVTESVSLLRGLQLQVKYALLMLDPSGEGLPRSAQEGSMENADW